MASLLSLVVYILVSATILALLFVLAVYAGARIAVNRDFRETEDGIEVYLATNGMHVDFILPTDSAQQSWSRFLPNTGFAEPLHRYPYLGIGWGAPEFYHQIETWDHVPFKVAFRALALPTPTIMHVTAYRALPHDTLSLTSVRISERQYARLCAHIRDSFAHDEPRILAGLGYTADDNFYPARGSYHVFHTCNCWVNKGLKRSGIYAPLWSPLERGIFYQLRKAYA